MIRDKIPLRALQGERYFRWRGGDESRVEGLTDAVIALAISGRRIERLAASTS